MLKNPKLTKEKYIEKVKGCWKSQRLLIQHFARKYPEVFINLFLSSHIKTGTIADFHKEWIELIVKKQHNQVLIVAPREHAKSTVISLAIPLYFICSKLKRFIVIASDSSKQSELLLGSIKRELEENPLIRLVYGDLIIPELQEKYKTKKWSASELLTTNRVRLKAISSLERVRGLKDKDQRPDLIVFDDLENEVDLESDIKRQKSWNWFTQTALSLGDNSTQYVMVGTYLHKEGVIGRIINTTSNFGWNVKFYKILKEDNTPLWPEYWSKERIERKRKSIGEIAFEREFLMNPEAVESHIFDLKALERANERGKHLVLVSGINRGSRGEIKHIVAGVDLAVKVSKHSGFFSMLTMGVKEDGEHVVLNIIYGKLSPLEQRQAISAEYAAFNHDLILVENNAYQDALVQEIQSETDVPVRGFQTTKQKYDPELGINSLAVLFENNKVTLPYSAQDLRTVQLIDKLLEQCKIYPIGHTGDILMSFWFANTAYQEVKSKKCNAGAVDAVLDIYNMDAYTHKEDDLF